jgi:hypothetical protein
MVLGDAPPTISNDKKPTIQTTPVSNDVSATTDTTELPEPPVVVYVKEVGKAGI